MKVLDAFFLSVGIAGVFALMAILILAILGANVLFNDTIIAIASLLTSVFYFLIISVWRKRKFLDH